jgi:hypothetical protein
MSALVAGRNSLATVGFPALAPAGESGVASGGGSSLGIRKMSETRSMNAFWSFFSAAAIRTVDATQR